jgi:hypothetical protein
MNNPFAWSAGRTAEQRQIDDLSHSLSQLRAAAYAVLDAPYASVRNLALQNLREVLDE